MSVYGFPREPETGDEIPPTQAAHDRVVSRPVSVPITPPAPPAPLLPPDPPGFSYDQVPPEPPPTHTAGGWEDGRQGGAHEPPPGWTPDPYPAVSGLIPPQRQAAGRAEVPHMEPPAWASEVPQPEPPAWAPGASQLEPPAWTPELPQPEPPAWASAVPTLEPPAWAPEVPPVEPPAWVPELPQRESSAWASVAPAPGGNEPDAGWHTPTELGEPEPSFGWLRPAGTDPEPPGQPAGVAPVGPAPVGLPDLGGGDLPIEDQGGYGLPRRVPIDEPVSPPGIGMPPVPAAGLAASLGLGVEAPVDMESLPRPGFGPSPSMGQPPVAIGIPPAAVGADRTGADRTVSADPGPPGPPAFSGPAAPAWGQPLEDEGTLPVSIPKHDSPKTGDTPAIPPWDSKPLIVVIASVVVLVLIGIVSGVVSAAVASGPSASWRAPGSAPTPDPNAPPSEQLAPPASPPGETVTMSGVGDVIMGSANLGMPPNDGAGFFDPVRDALAADLVMGNLDMALSDPTGFEKCSPGATDCFQLSLPPSYANVLRDGGFQLMSLANNHTQDQGAPGYANTQAALDAASVQHTGGVDQITYITVKNVKVAVLGFSVYSYTANLNDIPRAVGLVEEAAAQADIVVIQMQGGAEGTDKTSVPPAGTHEDFFGEDRGDLRGFAHAVIDAGADAVFGHGPHVMRGLEFYQGRLIAYSLGNFCGYRVLASGGWSGVGGILKLTLNRDGSWAGGQLIATEMVDGGLPAIDAEARALGFVDDLSVQDFGSSAARVDHTTGAITVPA